MERTPLALGQPSFEMQFETLIGLLQEQFAPRNSKGNTKNVIVSPHAELPLLNSPLPLARVRNGKPNAHR